MITKEFGVYAGDVVKVKSTDRIGLVSRVWHTNDGTKIEIKFIDPDEKLWYDIETVEIIIATG